DQDRQRQPQGHARSLQARAGAARLPVHVVRASGGGLVVLQAMSGHVPPQKPAHMVRPVPRCCKSVGPREGPRRAADPAPSGAGQRIIARMDRYERILSLHRILKTSRYPVTVARLQEELECSRATVYRDLAFLRDALMAPV